MNELTQDIRYAFRSFRGAPGFTAAVVATLSVVIGAAVTMFAFVDAVLLRPLPYADPDRIVRVFNTYGLDGAPYSISPPDFMDRRTLNRTFSTTTAYRNADYNLTGNGDPLRLSAALVSADLFPLLGVSPVVGRTFSTAEDQPGSDAVIVLSSRLWRERFGEARDIIGKTILLNDRPRTVIGVMPDSFRFPDRHVDVWLPIAFTPQQTSDASRGNEYIEMIARLKPGVSLAVAQQDLDAIVRWATEKDVDRRDYLISSHWGAYLVPLREAMVGEVRPIMTLLSGAVILLLLIGCANVASLLMARATARRKEILIRRALGAGATRIARQLVTESILLALLAGALGVALAVLFTRLLPLIAIEGIPRLEEATIGARALLFALAASLLSAILFGVAPALRVSRPERDGAMWWKGGPQSDGMYRSGVQIRSLLVQVEVALAVVLVTGGILLLRSLVALENVAPGFDPRGVLTFRVALPQARYATPESRVDFFRRLEDRLVALPGMRTAGMTSTLPLGGEDATATFVAEDRPLVPGEAPPGTHYRTVAGAYFRSMGIPVLQGRDFERTDNATAPRVVIIDRAIARMIWPGENAIGKRISFSISNPRWREVVGVVEEVKHKDLSDREVPTIYFPLAQNPQSSMYVVARQAAEGAVSAEAIRAALQAEDALLPLWRLQPMEQYLDSSLSRPRFRTILLGSFAVVALFLSLLGIYALVSYTVQQTRREIGIRMALGATARDVVMRSVRWSTRLMVFGLALGVVATFFLGRFVRSQLFGVEVLDPVTYVAVTVLFAVTGLVASLIPSRRAAETDPMTVLRYE